MSVKYGTVNNGDRKISKSHNGKESQEYFLVTLHAEMICLNQKKQTLRS